MKRLLAAATTFGTYLFVQTSVFAAGDPQLNVNVTKPEGGLDPTTPVGWVISNALTIIFIVAALAVLFMMIIGAFRWITSAGDKEAVKTARSQIVNALIGLAVLAAAYLIVTVVGKILGFQDLSNFVLPKLDQKPPAATQSR